MIDYNFIFKETMEHYFEDDYCLLLDKNPKVKMDTIKATTIDEYLVRLIEGYINTTIEEKLEKYSMDLLREGWFHQWPLVRWAYASRLLYNPDASEQDINRAIEILVPLSKEGFPSALGDIAYCYRYGIGVERSYEKAICLLVMASKKGYYKAREYLKMEYEQSRSKELPEELRLFLVNRVLWMFIEDHGLRVENSIIYHDELSADADKVLMKICNEHKRLRKAVQEKALLRHTGHLCWSDEDNPYNIEIKLK